MLRLLVPEHNAENVILHDLLDALGDAAKKFFAVEDGGYFAADVVEQSERIGLIRMRKEQALRDGVCITQQRKGAGF